MPVYFGDIHNHCGISYGHGPLEDALDNARQQLDFCSVTGHAHWPDMPEESPRLDRLARYHREGFETLARNWSAVLDRINAANTPGRFVTFPSFEWHNMRAGDRTLYYRDGRGDILRPDTIEALHAQVAGLRERGVEMMVLPHHIGYLSGRRGLNWELFDAQQSPIVEIVSMHGCAETDESPRPYLHTMGPCDARGTMQHGLALGHVFGVTGSTDHHSAHPGSYGHGRMGVWAQALTREALWDAFFARRTYALTGDRITLDFRVNGEPMGAVLSHPTRDREVRIAVRGGGAIDFVELMRNNAPIARWSAHKRRPDRDTPPEIVHAKVLLEVGWGERGPTQEWDVRFGIDRGELLAVEPRFRGAEVVAPAERPPDRYAYSECERVGPREVRFRTRTQANPNTSTNATQGVLLEVKMPRNARVYADFGVCRAAHPLETLVMGSRVGYLGGFVSPAYRFARAVLPAEFDWEIDTTDKGPDAPGRDWYYVRVCQKNGQWAWSSPIWVDR